MTFQPGGADGAFGAGRGRLRAMPRHGDDRMPPAARGSPSLPWCTLSPRRTVRRLRRLAPRPGSPVSSAASTALPAHGALPALDTLQGLLRRGLTGCLSVRDAHGGVRQVYLSQGEVFAALAPEDGPWLLRRLLNQGLIGERQAASISWSLGRGGAYEELLSGHVPDALLFAAMEDRFRQNLAEFIGQPGRLEWTATEGIFVANVQGGHDTARLLRGLLDALEQTAPLLARREALTLRPGAHPPQRPEQQRLAELCAPTALLAEVLAFSPHEELDTAGLLIEMLSQGILSTVEPLRLPVHRPPAVEDAYEIEELFSLDDAGAGRPAPTLPVSYLNALSEPVEVPDGQDFGDGLGEELSRWIARGASADAPAAPRVDEEPSAPHKAGSPAPATDPAAGAAGLGAGLVWAEEDEGDAQDAIPVGLSIMGAPPRGAWADEDEAVAPAPTLEFVPLDERRLPAADAVPAAAAVAAVPAPSVAAASPAPLPFDSAALEPLEDDVGVDGFDDLPADAGTEELPVEAASEDELGLDEPALGADELVDSLGGRISLVNFRRDPIPPGTEALSPPPAPAPDELVQTAARYLEEAAARRAARPRRAASPPPDEDLDAWLHGGGEATPAGLPEGASRWLPPRDAELDPALLSLFSDQDDIRGLGDGHFSVAERNLDRVDLRDELPAPAPRRAPAPPVHLAEAEGEEVLEAAEADAEAEANAINLNFGPPPLRDEEARSKLAVAQDVLVQLARRLDAHSGVGAGSAAVQVLLESTPGGGRRLFSHVNAGMDGRVDLNLVVSNLRRLPEPERRSALDAALMDLIDRALGVGCEALPNAEVDDLIGAIAGYQQRLGL
jgi:hypothetical protein